MPDQRADARKRTIVPAAVAVAAALVAVALILLPQLSGGATERDHAEGRPTTGDPASSRRTALPPMHGHRRSPAARRATRWRSAGPTPRWSW